MSAATKAALEKEAKEKALIEEDEDNFKQYVLYVKKGDKNSEDALELLKLSRSSQCVIQEVSLIMLPRPSWLVSVPTLVDRHTQTAKRGSAAMEVLSSWAASAKSMSSGKIKGFYAANSFQTPDE
jgi:hypothetical protein